MTDRIFAEFNNSFKFDRRLFQADARVSLAYCDELFNAGILTRLEAERLKNGLHSILKRADFDKNYFQELPSRDIHSFIEMRLVQLIGDAGEKLRVGRSRIDQSATAFRLWLREEIEETSKLTKELQKSFVAAAENHKEAVLPAYRHLRRTQPILWAHWCLAYFEMLARDRERLDEVWRRVNVLPLGAASAAGTSFEIDRESLARRLQFEGVAANSLDAVSDGDFAVEFLAACSLSMVHLSRFAGDLILYSSAEFGFIELSDAALNNLSDSTAQNENLLALELIRGKAGRVSGLQTAILSTLKGLPLGYSQDLQEEKETVFEAADTISHCLRAAKAVLENLRFNVETARRAATKGYLNAEELFDYLALRNLPIKAARQIVEQVVSYAKKEKKELNELHLPELQKFSRIFEADALEILSLEQTLASKNQIGGTSPERVFEALENAAAGLDREEN